MFFSFFYSGLSVITCRPSFLFAVDYSMLINRYWLFSVTFSMLTIFFLKDSKIFCWKSWNLVLTVPCWLIVVDWRWLSSLNTTKSSVDLCRKYPGSLQSYVDYFFILAASTNCFINKNIENSIKIVFIAILSFYLAALIVFFILANSTVRFWHRNYMSTRCCRRWLMLDFL